jgi:hypothetical protein
VDLAYPIIVILIRRKLLEKFKISDINLLLKAADLMHDAGFENEDIIFEAVNNILKINANRYEYKGKVIQRKTDKVLGHCEFVLNHIRNCNIVEKDKKGLAALGEDFFNLIEIKSDKALLIKTVFREIRLETDILDGSFEYKEL